MGVSVGVSQSGTGFSAYKVKILEIGMSTLIDTKQSFLLLNLVSKKWQVSY